MEVPLVSVVLPTYNYAHFLPEAVASVAAQTYPRMELVCVDDCSTDESREVLRDLASTCGQRFEGGMQLVWHETNQGAHAALNAGIRKAKGAVISVLNADDLYEPNRLEAATRAMRRASSPFCYTDVRCIGRDGTPIRSDFARHIETLPGRSEGRAFAALAAVAENIAVSTGNMIFEKALWDRAGAFAPYRYVHDYDFLMRVFLLCEPVYVPETRYLYRIHGENSFTKLRRVGISENRLVWLEVYGNVKAGRVENPAILQDPEYKEAFRAAAAEYGFQKKVMWRLAGTPAGRLVRKMLLKRLPYMQDGRQKPDAG